MVVSKGLALAVEKDVDTVGELAAWKAGVMADSSGKR